MLGFEPRTFRPQGTFSSLLHARQLGLPLCMGPETREERRQSHQTPSMWRTVAQPVRQRRIPGQALAPLWPPRPPGPAGTVHMTAFPAVSDAQQPHAGSQSGHTSITHDKGPAPLVLAETVASPGAQGCGGPLPEWLLLVQQGKLLLQVLWRHLRHGTQAKDFTGAFLLTGRIRHSERVHSVPKRAKRKRMHQKPHPMAVHLNVRR